VGFKIFALIDRYAAWIGNYRRFGTPYRSRLQGSSSPLLGLVS